MRLLTWNVNGIKTLLQYHPWRDCRTYEGIMEHLGADIICLQETKITRAQMDKSMACMNKFETFISFYSRAVKGVHGTAIFTKNEVTVPVKAEEGIGSCLLPATLAEEDRIGGYPLGSDVDLNYNEMKDLDAEGRTTVCDFGLFVLINLYCPNETNDDRLVFKNYFNSLVDRRVRNLIKAGRHVIVVGDLNICASNLDTAEPGQRAKEQGLEEFTDHPPRKWLKQFTGPGGPMIDITRRFHPTRKGMFTCWNTKIDARPSNYGTRLDYILITPGLLPWVRDSNIQATVTGSDHCPVYIDFHDEIQVEGKGTVKLWDVMNPNRKRDEPSPTPPAFAARNFKEFSSAQQSLKSFFGGGAAASSSSARPSSSAPATGSGSVSPMTSVVKTGKSSAPSPSAPASSTTKTKMRSASAKLETSENSQTRWKGKEKETEADTKARGGQQSISNFFKPPPKPEKPAKKKKATKAQKAQTEVKRQPSVESSGSGDVIILDDADGGPSSNESFKRVVDQALSTMDDTKVAVDISDDGDAHEDAEDYDATASVSQEAASAWSSIFATKAAPVCDGHGEPCKLWTVNKTGINKGRRFYLCQRPVGPGYDKGQAKLNVNPEFRCNFFQWETSVKRPAGISLDGWSQKKKKA